MTLNEKQKLEKISHCVKKTLLLLLQSLGKYYVLAENCENECRKKIVCRMINYFQDYETCVKRGDKECTYVDGDERDDFGQQTEFFCGQEDDCT